LAGDIGARLAVKTCADSVENEYCRAIIFSLDYVPGLRDTKAGNPARQRGRDKGSGGNKPPLWRCGGSYISEVPL
jgi:hypothetical protein